MKATTALPSAMLGKLSLYLSLLLLTQCSQCKRDDPAPLPPKDPLSLLPPESQTGKGTCGCLVNGKVFVAPFTTSANGDWQSINKLAVSSTMRLNGNDATQLFSFATVLNGRLFDTQKFVMISAANPPPVFSPGTNQFIADADDKCYYSGNYTKTGQVELVKFDGVARIAAGRFAFTLYEPGGCDTLRVTNGRFDVKF